MQSTARAGRKARQGVDSVGSLNMIHGLAEHQWTQQRAMRWAKHSVRHGNIKNDWAICETKHGAMYGKRRHLLTSTWNSLAACVAERARSTLSKVPLLRQTPKNPS